MSAETPRRLGRGLEALISNATRGAGTPAEPRAVIPEGGAPPPARSGGVIALPADPHRIPISQIRANPFQPRREFRPEELRELEDSLRSTGLLQPITVRRAPNGGGYELAAGERRLRAATNIGWKDIPANVRDFDDQELLAVALVENLQRADLNPIEEAQGYSRLVSEFGLTHSAVATVVGKDRSTVANMLRLLQLPAIIRTMVQSSTLSLGHARALLSLGNESEMVALANEAVSGGWSVREVERRVRDRKPTPKKMSDKATVGDHAHAKLVKQIEDQLRKRLQTDVSVSANSESKGSISIAFYNADDLERLLDVILGPHREVY
jgi:ParB family chromosome partitioning protein